MPKKIIPKQRIKKLEKAYDKFTKTMFKLSEKQDKLVKNTIKKVEELKIRAIKATIE